MSWAAFALSAWVMLGFELGLKPLIAPGSGDIAPSFIVPLLVFIALHAPHRAALWAAVVLGVLVDITSPMPRSGGGVITLVGPNALGYLIACQFVLSVRGVVIRRNPLTMIFLSILAAVVSGIVVVAILTARSFYPAAGDWQAGRELLAMLGSSLYTGVSAAAVSMLLFAAVGLFGFASDHRRQVYARRP